MTNSCTTMLVSQSASAGTSLLVLRGEQPRHVLGLGGGEQHFGADQRPGEIGAEHRDQHADADEHRAPVPDDELEHVGHRGLAHAGDVGARQHRVGQQRDRDHQAGHADEAEDGRAADVGALLGKARIDARAFDAEEHEHRDQHRVAHLLDQRFSGMPSPPKKFSAEQVELEGEDQDDDEDHDRHDLGDGDDVLMKVACWTPRRIMKWNSQMPTEATDDRDDRVAVAEHRERTRPSVELISTQ